MRLRYFFLLIMFLLPGLSHPSAPVGDEFMERFFQANTIVEGDLANVECNQFAKDRCSCMYYFRVISSIADFSDIEREATGAAEVVSIRLSMLGQVPDDPYSAFPDQDGVYPTESGSTLVFLHCSGEYGLDWCFFSNDENESTPLDVSRELMAFLESAAEPVWPMCVSEWDDMLYQDVKETLSQLTISEPGAVYLDWDLGLGAESAPYLILLMDDTKIGGGRSIKFRNSEDAFEKYADIHVNYIVEVIDSVLRGYSSRRVSSIDFNLQSEGQLRHSSNGWRYWWNQSHCPELNSDMIDRIWSEVP